MKMQSFNVWLNGRKIDKVFYDKEMTVEEVKKSLVNHDGYSKRIKVTKERR